MSRRVRDKAGLPPDFRPLHGLRHSFASRIASSGEVDIYRLQALMTHKTPKMTQRYAHLSDESMRKAAAVAASVMSKTADDDTG
jgi:integrase